MRLQKGVEEYRATGSSFFFFLVFAFLLFCFLGLDFLGSSGFFDRVLRVGLAVGKRHAPRVSGKPVSGLRSTQRAQDPLIEDFFLKF